MRSAILFLVLLLIPTLSRGTTYYVLAGGSGRHTGTNWANADCKIPAPLAAGDVVYIGNSGGNLADTTTTCTGEATHVFSTSGTPDHHITIKAATGADHGTSTGWSSSYGVDVTPAITWSNNFVATDGLKSAIWDFCGSYYDIDGKVGTSDHTGSYGFYFRSAGRLWGFVRADTHACGEASITNLTFNNIEMDGVDSAAAVVLGAGTVNTRGTAVTWASDATGSPRSQFDTSGYWKGKAITIHGVVYQGAKGISAVNSATTLTLGGSGAGTQTGVKYTVSQPGAAGFYIGSPVSGSATVRDIGITSSYLHDISIPIYLIGNDSNITVRNDWIYTNFSDAAQHSNGISNQRPSGGTVGVNNLIVSESILKNIQGTGFIVCLGGTCDNWHIYNNIFYYTNDWDSICERKGDTTATCGVSKLSGDNGSGSMQPGGLTNAVFFGNTISGIHLKPGHPGADQAALVIQLKDSSGNVAQNNLWYNCTLGGAFNDGSSRKPNVVSHDYNTLLNTGYAPWAMSLSTHEAQIGASGPTIRGTAIDPFMSDSTGNFKLSSETVDAHLNHGAGLASPYNVDFDQVLRGADGSWELGAFEFVNGKHTNPQDNPRVTGVH